MENLKSENKKWLYVSIRYEKILNNDLYKNYGDLVYKCNFLIYGNEEKIKEIQKKHKDVFYISCCYDETGDVFKYVNVDILNKNLCYVNFFECNINNFSFQFCIDNEEDFFKKFFYLCENLLQKQTLNNLERQYNIAKIDYFKLKKAILFNQNMIKIIKKKEDTKNSLFYENFIYFGDNEEIKVSFDEGFLKIVDIKDNTKNNLIKSVILFIDYFNKEERQYKEKIKEEKNEPSFNISFNVKDMIEEAKLQGFNCNEEEAKSIIEYLNNHCLEEVFKEIDNIIFNYCNNKGFKKIDCEF